MPQRIRAITWNRTHINYTECVKSERVGIRYVLRKVTQSLRFSNVIPARGNDWTTVFIIHKRELSDSMVESGSSLFYLLHCSAHDRLNTTTFRSFRNIPHGLHRGATGTTCSANSFVSAHPTRIASVTCLSPFICAPLCLSTSRTDCITRTGCKEPSHTLCLSTSRMDCISKIAQMQCHKSTQYAVSW